jgi:hypothetical protein
VLAIKEVRMGNFLTALLFAPLLLATLLTYARAADTLICPEDERRESRANAHTMGRSSDGGKR